MEENTMKDLKEATIEELKQLVLNAEKELSKRYDQLAAKQKAERIEREKNCDHEYIHTNTKYRGSNEQRCIHCGKTINS